MDDVDDSNGRINMPFLVTQCRWKFGGQEKWKPSKLIIEMCGEEDVRLVFQSDNNLGMPTSEFQLCNERMTTTRQRGNIILNRSGGENIHIMFAADVSDLTEFENIIKFISVDNLDTDLTLYDNFEALRKFSKDEEMLFSGPYRQENVMNRKMACPLKPFQVEGTKGISNPFNSPPPEAVPPIENKKVDIEVSQTPSTPPPSPLPTGLSSVTSEVEERSVLIDINVNANATNTNSNIVGLPNLGNSCYMNSVLQSLFSLQAFQFAMETGNIIHPPGHKYDSRSLFYLVYSLMRTRPNSHRFTLTIRLEDIRKKVLAGGSRTGGSVSQQQDAHEFLCLVLNDLDREIEIFTSRIRNSIGTNPSLTCEHDTRLPLIRQNFQILVEQTVACSSCTNRNTTEIQQNDIDLCVGDNLQNCLDKYFSRQELNYTCTSCGCKMGIILRIKKLPRVLILLLKRYQQGFNSRSKNTKAVVIPRVINMEKYSVYSNEFLSPEMPRTPSPKYYNFRETNICIAKAFKSMLTLERPMTSMSRTHSTRQVINNKRLRESSTTPEESGPKNNSTSHCCHKRPRNGLSMVADATDTSTPKSSSTCEVTPSKQSRMSRSDNFNGVFPGVYSRARSKVNVDKSFQSKLMDCSPNNNNNNNKNGFLNPPNGEDDMHDNEVNDKENKKPKRMKEEMKNIHSSFFNSETPKKLNKSLFMNKMDEDVYVFDETNDTSKLLNGFLNGNDEVTSDVKTVEMGQICNKNTCEALYQDVDSSKVYELVSVISHLGFNDSCGHYISECYDFDTRLWYCFDDIVVKETNVEEVTRSRRRDGYLFFYVSRSASDEFSRQKKQGGVDKHPKRPMF